MRAAVGLGVTVMEQPNSYLPYTHADTQHKLPGCSPRACRDRALQRHLGPHQQLEQHTRQQGRVRVPNPRAAAPHPDAPRGRGGVFYHDDVLHGLLEEAGAWRVAGKACTT